MADGAVEISVAVTAHLKAWAADSQELFEAARGETVEVVRGWGFGPSVVASAKTIPASRAPSEIEHGYLKEG